MKFQNIIWQDLSVVAQESRFVSKNGSEDLHLILHVSPSEGTFSKQFSSIVKAIIRIQEENKDKNFEFCRFFVSDATNQMPVIKDEFHINVPFSVIQQPPLDGSKVAAWLYFRTPDTRFRHIWKGNLVSTEGSSYDQTRKLLEDYENYLEQQGGNLANNCVRTWFFVRDVDTQYHGLVVARKDNFISQDLTERTHYLASTGIGGLPADTKAIVQMDTYAIIGIEPHQQRYLYAKTHLNPTYEYGVTFERGTAINLGDKTQILISGTASINNKGEVVHIGDIEKQTERMLENVQELLKEGGANFSDIMEAVVYLRDIADYTIVKNILSKRLSDIPLVITYAPVCRPAWLIEMECIAMRNNQ